MKTDLLSQPEGTNPFEGLLFLNLEISPGIASFTSKYGTAP